MSARLSSLDSSFLRVESASAHMHVGWLSMLELPDGAERLDPAALVAQVAGRLQHAPRFRQRVVQSPFSLTEPSWEDDSDFHILRHIHVVDEGSVSSRRLGELTDAFLSQQLPRDRPLWSLLLVPRCEGRRAALVGKVHHAMVDGVAAVELGMLLFDASPDATPATPALWEPATGGGGPVRLVLDSIADSALEQFRTARQVARLGLSPGAGLRVADNVRRAAMSLAGDVLRPAPQSMLNVEIGPRRRLVRHGVALARVSALRRGREATLNDVILSVCAGALRKLFIQSGEEARDLRVMVPVNVRSDGDSAAQGNRISFAFVELPLSEPVAMKRLERVHTTMAELKRSGKIAGTDLLLRSTGTLPEPFKKRAAQLAASPRLYNLTISNVPGPRFSLYAAGARVRSVYPVIPIPEGHALSFGVLTYDRRVHFAAYVDPDALPRAGRLSILLEDAVEELAAGGGSPRLRPGRRALSVVGSNGNGHGVQPVT
ncbi:MAG TPA: wax ester/triacylglycerol synthase family O-acyltransferase [Thermoleophilaceae bacterium]